MLPFARALNNLPHPRLFVGASLVSCMALWAVFFVAPFRLTDTIPLHADAYFGIDAVGPGWWVLAVPVGATLFALIHFLLALVFDSKETIARLALLVSIPVVLLAGSFILLWLLVLLHHG